MDDEAQSTQTNVGFNVPFMGHMEEYSTSTDWKQYVERLEIFFEVNNVPREKQASSILTLMGSKMYALLRSITAPRRPKELTYNQIVETVTQHLEPKPIVIAERYKFHKAEQGQAESIREYIAKLQRLAETCEFGSYRDEAIRDRFVCGLRDRSIQRKLLGEVDLTLKSAVEKACAAELTERGNISVTRRITEPSANSIPRVFLLCNVDSDSESQEEDMKTWPVFTLTDSRKKCKEMEVLVQWMESQSVPFALKDKVKEEIYRLEKLGVLEKVEFSDWATPIVPVLKPDGSVRICGDYKVTINQSLDVQEYPMPTAEELFTKLRGGIQDCHLELQLAQLFSKNDGYGFEWFTGVGGILDDFIITGKNDEEHLRNLERALKRLQNMGIKLKKSKCVFMQPSVENFAFVVDRQGIHPSPRKVQAIREVPTPENPTELKSFLGLVNYYRKFIPNMAKLVNPLNCLLSQEVTWKWSEECQKSFETLKVLLETAPNNANVDALSRLPRKSVEEPDEWEEEAAAVNSAQLKRSPVSVSMIREATQKDSVLSRVVYYLLHGWPEGKLPEELQYFFTKQDEFTVEEGCLLRGTRLVIPTKYQGVVLSELHINHPGRGRMKSLARLHVWWSTLDQDIEQTVRDCTSCQFNRFKSPLKVNNPWIWPVRPWQRIHVDFAVHGLPEEMVSDNGPQFVAQEMKDFLKGNGIQMHLSSPYHPASNGEAERAVGTFKDSMKIRKNEEGSTGEKLARFLLGYRTTPHTATGCTPTEILMGR
ncbi:uncharacterized protein K02A2.6-like [Xenia sp. Carnegie-2017]|uniref:uncharacterized protein K02A2.6-like n=1 Tax=Xenia sp. Carnegie-2017 TaxID=2897299 RepID=UPI001F0476DC|nr:uncharacterized protein K02A2.6-like [Xenia sp. Carnegie-2017]